MRLAVQMRQPLAEVLAWPDSHVRLLLAFLSKEPPVDERIELVLAGLSAMTFNVNRGKSVPAKDFTEFLFASDPWGVRASRAAPSELDSAIAGALDKRHPTI